MGSINKKYVTAELKKDIVLPWGAPGAIRAPFKKGKTRMMEHAIWLDGEVGTGTFYAECLWLFPDKMICKEEKEAMAQAAKMIKPGMKVGPQPHNHPFDELFAFFGTNFDNPHDLGGELRFDLEDQTINFDKSCTVYIPNGMKHCPLGFNRIEKPMFHFSLAPSPTYDRTILEGSGKYAGQDVKKYYIYDPKKAISLPSYRHAMPKDAAYQVAYLDSKTLPGATYYSDSGWLYPGNNPIQKGKEAWIEPHKLPHSEVLGFFGTDFNDIRNLGGEIELWIDGKKNVINKTFVAVIPPGVEYGPLKINKIKKPVFYFIAGLGKSYL
jgi:hypothetical protein